MKNIEDYVCENCFTNDIREVIIGESEKDVYCYRCKSFEHFLPKSFFDEPDFFTVHIGG